LLASIFVLASNLVAQGFNVQVAAAIDTDFWIMVRLSEPTEEMALLAMPNHHNNLYAAEPVQARGLDCRVITISRHKTEAMETRNIDIPLFNQHRETG